MNAFFETMESRVLLSATISATQKANLTKLATDLKAIHSASGVTTTQIHQLETALATAVKGASKPSAATVTAFKNELKSALADGKLTTVEKKTLVVDFDAILTSAGVTTAEAEAVGNDLKVIVDASHVTTADVSEIVGDLEAIAATFKAKA